ncbi:hypothetical protein CERZMDRAFT_80980 [Cercospora zeae-maydis SCOH1-5]|uniref:Uncharacterized protein n=1 Tax=Cercospora zeae-maydis SCOH1-5 TaxID=717836 RepID=A0A6A6FUQ6_9PEZI|nr:hypothetical protein CERZMDRAFT_80980 [Cercospora zeae-maydis SCOH1-5]
MPSGWKRWWRNNLNKLKKKNKNRPVFDRDFHEGSSSSNNTTPPHTQQRPFAHGIDFPGPPLPPQAVARDPFDRFGGNQEVTIPNDTDGSPRGHARATSYSRLGQNKESRSNRPASAGSPEVSIMVKVSPGVVLGIAAGCLIAGVLVCGLAFYLYGRRRQFFQQKKSNSGRDGDGAILEEMMGEKQRGGDFDPDQLHDSPTSKGRQRSRASSTSSTSTATIGTIESIDQEVREEFQRLNVAIRGHAELYYNLRPVECPDEFKKMSCSSTNLVTLNNLLGPDAPINAITTDVLLRAPETRHDTIRFVLAWVLFRFIQPDAPIEQTLLPPELVKCAQAMSRRDSQNASDQAGRRRSASLSGGRNVGARSPSPLKSNPGIGASNRQPAPSITSDPATASSATAIADERLSFARWRSMSGKLFYPVYGTGEVAHPTASTPPDPREKNVDQLVTSLVCLLQPYVAKGYGGARVRDLEAVVKSAAGFGYKLFTQKTEWEFAWSTLMSDEVVVFPALVKVGDDRGHQLRQSIVLTWEETVRLDEHVLDLVRRRESDLRTIEEAFEEF